jgi:hypothetical protein
VLIACSAAFIVKVDTPVYTVLEADAKKATVTHSEAWQNIDNGQNLLLTQAFTPTSSEDMHGKSTCWSQKRPMV